MNSLNRDTKQKAEDIRWSLRCRGCEMLIGCSHQQGCPEAGRATCVLIGHCDQPITPKPNGWEELKNKYPELYEAIVAHSVWYDCGVGEGLVMDDRALPLGWLASYFDIVKSQAILSAEERAREETTRQMITTIQLWRPYFYEKKITKTDKEVLQTMIGELNLSLPDQATQNINNLDKE